MTVDDGQVEVDDGRRVAMTVPIDGLRRVEIGIEKGRPVTLILVPESPARDPQVLTIPEDQYEAVSRVLVDLARAIARPVR